MKPEMIQNLQILGTIGDNRNEFIQICERLEQIANFAYNAYLQKNKSNNVHAFLRLKDDQYLLLAIKAEAKNNPYFSVCKLNENPHNRYTVDISVLFPILDDSFVEAFERRVLASFDHQLGLQAAVEEMNQYIDEYDDPGDLCE